MDPWLTPPQGCTVVPHVCFEAEQILLHGRNAAAAMPSLMRLLNGTRDPSDVFSKLRPTIRPTVLLDPSLTEPYDYLPLAMGAKRVPNKDRALFTRSHMPSDPRATGWSKDPAVAFFTSWSNSFTEIFSRAVVRLFELVCAMGVSRHHLRLFPAMWGASWGYARPFLRLLFFVHRVVLLAGLTTQSSSLNRSRTRRSARWPRHRRRSWSSPFGEGWPRRCSTADTSTSRRCWWCVWRCAATGNDLHNGSRHLRPA